MSGARSAPQGENSMAIRALAAICLALCLANPAGATVVTLSATADAYLRSGAANAAKPNPA